MMINYLKNNLNQIIIAICAPAFLSVLVFMTWFGLFIVRHEMGWLTVLVLLAIWGAVSFWIYRKIKD